MCNKADSLIELAKLAATRHDERRKYEWKVSFAFWAIIIGAIAKKSSLIFICPWLGITVVVLYAFLWLRGVWVANDNNKRESRHFIDEPLNSLRDPNYRPLDPPPRWGWRNLQFWFGFLMDWALLFHLAVTIGMVMIFFFLTKKF